MNKKIFTFGMIFFLSIPKIFALECPKFDEKTHDGGEIIAKVRECQEARKNWQTATITDFSCPAGDMRHSDQTPLSEESLTYGIAMNIMMNTLDKEVKKYMQELQKQRSKNGVAWTEDIRKCMSGTGENKQKSIESAYREICEFNTIRDLVNQASEKPILTTTESFPYQECHNLTERKIQAWNTLAKNLMFSGVAKSYQNDRNEFIDGIQGRYRTILEKFHTYQKIIFRASSKIGPYIQNPVK